MKRLIPFFIVISFLMFIPISAIAQLIIMEFKAEKDTETGQSVYNLVFKSGDEIIAKRTYCNGETILSEGKIPNGMVVESYLNGKVKNIMFYENGERNGPAISLYESGSIKSQIYYKNDNPIGKGFYYFESGAIKTEWEIQNGKEIYHYEYTESGEKGKYRSSDNKDVID